MEHRHGNVIEPPRDPVAAATHPDPYEYYAQLVAERPLHYDADVQCWVAASATAVSEVLMHPAYRVRPPAEPVPRALAGSEVGGIFARLVRMTDGEQHRSVKRAVTHAFERLTMSNVERASAEWAERLMTGPGASAPEVTTFTFHLPLHVVGSLLGVPHRQLGAMAEAVEVFAGAISPLASTENIAHGQAAAARLRAGLGPALARGDGTPALLEAFQSAARGEHLDDAIVTANAVGFLFQTCEATAGLIGNALVALGRRPELLDLVRQEPQHLPALVDEVLRDSPVQNTRRFVAEPSVVAGQPMREGEAILVLLAAANHDPAANVDPRRFDIFRRERRLFTFGAGVHACPGRALAVTVAAAAVDRVLRCGIDVQRLAARFTYRRSVNVRVPSFGL